MSAPDHHVEHAAAPACEPLRLLRAHAPELERRSKRIPIGVRARAPHVAWRNAARMRDRLAHHHWNVSPDLRWEVVSLELPALRDAVAALVAELDADSPLPS